MRSLLSIEQSHVIPSDDKNEISNTRPNPSNQLKKQDDTHPKEIPRNAIDVSATTIGTLYDIGGGRQCALGWDWTVTTATDDYSFDRNKMHRTDRTHAHYRRGEKNLSKITWITRRNQTKQVIHSIRSTTNTNS